MTRLAWVSLSFLLAAAVAPACHLDGDCKNTKTCDPPPGSGGDGAGAGSTGGATTTGGGGAGGTGGAPTCTEDPTLCEGDTPVCHEGACVPCTPEEDALCTGQTPWCNPATNACEGCSYHEHCPDSACNVFTGACLDATPETVGPGGDYPTLTLALDSVPDGAEAVFLVSPNTGMTPYVEDLQLGGTRVVALIAQNGRPRLSGVNFPTFTVANGATLLLEGIDLRGNTNSRGIQADGLVALDRVEIASNNGGGISASDSAELLLRNSIIAANGDDQTEDAITLAGAKAVLIYSTVAGLTVDPSAAVNCSSTYDLTVRNSILLKRYGSGSALAGCANASVTTSHDDSIDTPTGQTWFSGWASDLRLTAAGKTQFDGVAQWTTGDPPTDIDGTARPTAEGPDVAGAHLGP